MDIVQLGQKYVDIKNQLTETESKFKSWKSDTEATLLELSEKILAHMQETGQKSLHVSTGMFGTTTKSQASATNTAEFTTWLKEDPQNLDCAVIKPRQDAIKKFVELNGEPPVGIKYERTTELTFRKT